MGTVKSPSQRDLISNMIVMQDHHFPRGPTATCSLARVMTAEGVRDCSPEDLVVYYGGQPLIVNCLADEIAWAGRIEAGL